MVKPIRRGRHLPDVLDVVSRRANPAATHKPGRRAAKGSVMIEISLNHESTLPKPLFEILTRVRSLVLVWACCWISLLPAVTSSASSDTDALVQQGLQKLAASDFVGAESNFKKADKGEGGKCGACKLGLAMVYSRTGELKKGEKAGRAATELLKGHASEFLAYGELGRIYYHRGARKVSYYEKAESAFRTAFELSKEESKNALFYLGLVKLKLAEDDEGVAHLSRFVESYPDDENAELARELIANPLKARMELLPKLNLTTLEGEELTSESLRGRVVLLDFWATWCGPCRAAFPALRSMVERHKDDPFLLVSLSTDNDEAELRRFLAEEETDWPQVWDGRFRSATQKMGVRSYPTYVLVSPEGGILHRVSGGGPGVEADLRRRVAKAVRDAKQ